MTFNYRAMRKEQQPGYRFQTGGYDSFQVIVVCGGVLHFAGSGFEKALGPGDIAMLRWGSEFRLWCDAVGYRGVASFAVGAVPNEFRGAAAPLRADPSVRALVSLMERRMSTPGPDGARVLAGLGGALAWEAVQLSEASRRAAVRSPPYWAAAARAALDSSMYTMATVRQTLTSLGLSYRQIARHFECIYGVSPKRYQLRTRIEEARRLLRETDLDITSIAMELGFASSQHLATQFRAETGVTPSACRKR